MNTILLHQRPIRPGSRDIKEGNFSNTLLMASPMGVAYPVGA